MLPPLATYLPATMRLLESSNATHLFLQTATPTALAMFQGWGVERRWNLSFTENARTTHDLWMSDTGKYANYSATGERFAAVAQAVNAYIASHSKHFISPSASMWTPFIHALMGRPAFRAARDVQRKR